MHINLYAFIFSWTPICSFSSNLNQSRLGRTQPKGMKWICYEAEIKNEPPFFFIDEFTFT